MKNFVNYATTAFIAALTLAACTQVSPEPQPNQVLGLMRVNFQVDSSGTNSSAKLQPQALTSTTSGIQMKLINTSTFTTGIRGSGGERWVSATYDVRNATTGGTAYNTANSNISFLAVSTPTGLGESAIANMSSYGGTLLTTPTLAQSFMPTHGMRYNALNNTTEINPGAEDFQVFDETEVSSFATANVVPINYGFVVRRTSTNPVNRTLGANPSTNQFDGRVTFAVRFPLQTTVADDPFTFSMDFLVVTDDQTRVTQSLEQQALNSVPMQTSQLTGAVVNVMPGSTDTTATNRFIPSVRLARAATALNAIYLVQAPTAITVTSNADSGAGTLRNAIQAIASGGTINLNGINGQNIILISPLVIGKNLTITNSNASPTAAVLGGATAFNSSNVRIFDIQLGHTVTMSNFTIGNGYASGSSARGAGILNAGTLTLSNMKVQNNQAQGDVGSNGTPNFNGTQDGGVGGAAQGGAIYNSGTLTINLGSVFDSNKAIGGVGGAGAAGSQTNSFPNGLGGLGGLAQGGAVFNDGTATLSINTAMFTTNNATGGQGGTPGTALGGSGQTTFGKGGSGGNANGGAAFNANAVVGSATAISATYGTAGTANVVTGGLGVQGGTPLGSNNGTNGTTSFPNANF
jgi:trimeric autotransporter adhesin